MKNLPIDTSGMTLLCAAAPVAVVDFESKRPKTWSQNPSVVARRRKLIRVAARVSRGRRVRSVLS